MASSRELHGEVLSFASVALASGDGAEDKILMGGSLRGAKGLSGIRRPLTGLGPGASYIP